MVAQPKAFTGEQVAAVAELLRGVHAAWGVPLDAAHVGDALR